MFTKAIISTALFTGACATTATIPSTLPGDQSSLAGTIVIDPTRHDTDEAQPWFPQLATEAALPSAQTIRRELLATGHDRFAIGVRVCVSPTGTVAHVDLAESSGVAELDQLALQDISTWRYERFAGPAQLSTCKPLTLQYTP